MTNHKDYLSQEEIDALLKQSENLPDNGGQDTESILTSVEEDAIGEIGNITFGNAATALSALLGKKVNITTPKVSVVERANLKDEFPIPHIAVDVNFVEGFEGINLLVIKLKDARIIADLMLGGSGKVDDEELDEIHISAVQEAMNQMMGAAATSMSTIFNRFVNISPPNVEILDLAKGTGEDKLPKGELCVKVAFRLSIEGLVDSTIMQLLSIPFSKELAASLISDVTAPTRETEAETASAKAEPEPVLREEVNRTAERSRNNPVQTKPPQRDVKVQNVQYPDFSTVQHMTADEPNLNLLLDIPLKVTVELGRTKKQIREILELSQGSIIELDKLAGEPVDILVNNKMIAKGEVVVIDENFGVRVTDIISQADRIQKMN